MEREACMLQDRRPRFAFEPETIFIWVPKAAGTSMFRWLNSAVALRFLNHVRVIESLPIDEIEKIKALTFGHMCIDSVVDYGYLRPESLQKTFSFAFVRNPYTRVVSVWRYLIRQGVVPHDWGLDRFVSQLVRQNPRAGLFNEISLSHGAPMTNWIFQERWPGPHQIYHFEELSESISQLAEKLGVKERFPAENVGSYARGEISLGHKTLTKLQSYYRLDFENFGYSYDPPKSLFKL